MFDAAYAPWSNCFVTVHHHREHPERHAPDGVPFRREPRQLEFFDAPERVPSTEYVRGATPGNVAKKCPER